MNNPDHITESLETIFGGKILQFFDADPGWKEIRMRNHCPISKHCRPLKHVNFLSRIPWQRKNSGSTPGPEAQPCFCSVDVRDTMFVIISLLKCKVSNTWAKRSVSDPDP